MTAKSILQNMFKLSPELSHTNDVDKEVSY